MDQLIAPHGGELVNLVVGADRAQELKAASQGWPSWDLTPMQMCDIELLLCGGFSPLRGFMTRRDHEPVCRDLRLADGALWPIPVSLAVTAEFARGLSAGERVALRDPEGVMIAVLTVDDAWEADRAFEAESVFGTSDTGHRGVARLLGRSQTWYVGGPVEGLQLPLHYDSKPLRLTPAELRGEFSRLGWSRVIAFQTRESLHRAEYELTLRAIREHDANLLVHPVVGPTTLGDIDHYARVRCYEALMLQYPPGAAYLALLPLATRLAGPREALWHAIVHKNHGCSHVIVGQDFDGPRSDPSRQAHYEPNAAQRLLQAHQEELGVEVVPLQPLHYVEEAAAYLPAGEIPEGATVLELSSADLRKLLQAGDELPAWFTFPAVAQELQRIHPPRHEQGLTVFFTGLSGSGKSTIANALLALLLEMGGRPVTLLDGDVVRKNLSSELGFSREHRNLNIQRIGFVADQITKNGGIAICAPIAPYDAVRRSVRELCESHGGFVLVHVATPVEVCEKRDRKGLYAKARAGIIKEFTGISDPYEVPENAELTIDTREVSAEAAAQQVVAYLEREGYFGATA